MFTLDGKEKNIETLYHNIIVFLFHDNDLIFLST